MILSVVELTFIHAVKSEADPVVLIHATPIIPRLMLIVEV